MGTEKCFVPHRECTKAGGDCFNEGRCLDACKAMARRDLAKRVAQLERDLLALRVDFVRLQERR